MINTSKTFTIRAENYTINSGPARAPRAPPRPAAARQLGARHEQAAGGVWTLGFRISGI